MYQYYIDGVMLPIAPPSMKTKINNQNSTISLLNGEEINIIKSPGLTEVSFTVLLPNSQYPFATYEGGTAQNAQYYLDLFQNLKLSQKPFLFLVIRTDEKGNIAYQGSVDKDKETYYSLEEYTIEESAEDYGIDCGVEVILKQYRPYTTATGKIQTEDNGQSVVLEKQRDTTGKQTPKTYTVKKGDTLFNICKKELGDGSKYKEIAQKNNIYNPNVLQIGQIIRLE